MDDVLSERLAGLAVLIERGFGALERDLEALARRVDDRSQELNGVKLELAVLRREYDVLSAQVAKRGEDQDRMREEASVFRTKWTVLGALGSAILGLGGAVASHFLLK